MAKKIGERHRINDLTDLEVRAFDRRPGRLNDGAGLSLVVTRLGYRRWVFRYSFAGKQCDLFLGSTQKITLKRAREIRDEAKAHLAAGTNPSSVMNAQTRRAQESVVAGVPTFGQAADQYIANLAPTLKNKKSRQPWELAMQVYCSPLRALRLNAITTGDVAKVLRPIWQSKHETARKVRWRIEAVFAEAIVDGHRQKDPRGETIQIQNPAQWDNNLASVAGFKRKSDNSNVRHLPAMPYCDVPSFMSKLQMAEGMSARALELVILSVCRTGEAIGARWSEIDFESSLWVIPETRMKAHREHSVPLSKQAVAILKSQARIEASLFVFPGLDPKKHLSNMALLMQLRRMGLQDVTTHGFRTSFRTWASECTLYPREIAELSLAHQVGTEVERAYNRTTMLDKRRALRDAWASFVRPLLADYALSC